MNIRRDLIRVALHPQLIFEGSDILLEGYNMPQETADGLEKILQAQQSWEHTHLLSGNNEWVLRPNQNIAIVVVGAVDESGEEDYYTSVHFGIDFKSGKVFFTGAEDA
jgi:hypothetical protein